MIELHEKWKLIVIAVWLKDTLTIYYGGGLQTII